MTAPCRSLRSPPPPRRRGQRGSAVIEFSWLAIILLVPLVYMMLAVFDVQRHSYGATAATRAAARAFMIVPDGTSEDQGRERAFAAARLAMADQDAELRRDRFSLICDPACYQPGSRVTVRIETSVPLPFVPRSLGPDRMAVNVVAENTEPYGRFRQPR